MAMWYGGDQAFAALGAAPPARHIGLGPSFIDEYQPAWIKCWLHLFPEGSRLGDVAALLLGGVRGFFKLKSWRSNNRQIEMRPTAAPVLRNAAWIASSVISGAWETSAKICAPWASVLCERRSPPIGFAAILPVARHSRDILLTELGLTS